MMTSTISDLAWKRTGKITLRCEPYLIIRYPTRYTALYGLPGDRVEIGHYPNAAEARSACQHHAAAAAGEKKPA